MTTSKRRPKGSGMLTYDPERHIFILRKNVGNKADGRPKILTVRGKTESACLKEMAEKELDWLKSSSTISSVETMTVTEMCTKHLENQVESGLLALKSIDRRECTIKNQIGRYAFGRLQVASVNPGDIEDYIDMLLKTNLSASTIVKALDVISAAYDWMVSREDLSRNPVSAIRDSLKKKIARRNSRGADDMDVIVLNEVERKAFIAECKKRDANGHLLHDGAMLLLFLIETGMRVGELLALRRKDYDAETGLLRITQSRSMTKNRNKEISDEHNYVMNTKQTKNDKSRIIELSMDAVTTLEEIIAIYSSDDPDVTIVPEVGRTVPNTANKLEHRVKEVYRAIGASEEVSGLHILRRTFATTLYEAGVPVASIAAYIGDLESTTLKYYIANRKRTTINGEKTVYVPLPVAKKSL